MPAFYARKLTLWRRQELEEEADAEIEAVLEQVLAPVPRAKLPPVRQVAPRQTAAAAAAAAASTQSPSRLASSARMV